MQAELYEVQPCPAGRLAIAPRPRGDVWLRAELASMSARGVTDIVSLLMPAEEIELKLQAQAQFCQELGIAFHRHPVRDRGIPAQPDFDDFVLGLAAALQQGRFVAIHCRAGIGRSAVTAAALLCRFGVTADEALARISRARGFDVPDTAEQFDFIHDLAQRYAA